MKKWIALLLALVMCLALCACSGKESASESNQQETQGNEAAAAESDAAEKETNKKSESAGSEVVYDENGILVELRGVSEDQIVVYAENDLDEEIFLEFDDILYNGKYNIDLSNNGGFVQGHSVYLSTAQYNFLILVDDAKEYGIDEIQSIDCVLRIEYGEEGSYEDIADIPLSIPCDIKVP